MPTIIVKLDKRCCNKLKIPIQDFKLQLKRKLEQYEIKFVYENLLEDVICEKGYNSIAYDRISDEEINNIKKIIDEVFDSFIQR